MSPPAAAPLTASPPPRLGAAGLTLAGSLLVLLTLTTLRLLPEWRANPDLSHGFFTPLLFLVLVHESRTHGTRRWLPAGLASGALATGAALAGLALLFVASLYAVALDWTHPLAEYLSGLAVAAALVAALALAASDGRRWHPWNWAALVATGLWVLSLPLPPGTSARLTLHLQLWITDGVLTSLHWLGIPASRAGNIIDLGHTSVGVEEACSGVRSLWSCVYAAAFFSATLVSRLWSRAALLLLAPLLAFAMNFVRSLLLTLLAHRGADISGRWHDLTGIGILVVTAAVLAAVALALGARERREHTSPRAADAAESAPERASAHAPPGPVWLLVGGYAVALAWILTLALQSRPAPPTGPPPDLQAMLPREAAGWDQVQSDDLHPYAGVLQTDHLVQRTYLRKDAETVTQLTVYVAYWAPAQAPVSVVASHTPDLCWPGSGWQLDPRSPEVQRLSLERGRELSPAQYRRFSHHRLPQHVWFWHVYENRVIDSPDALSPFELLRSVFTFGVRSRGEQLFFRISSNRPWEELRDDPLVQDLFHHLRPFGI